MKQPQIVKVAMNMDEYKAEQRKEHKKDKEFRKMRRNRKWQWTSGE